MYDQILMLRCHSNHFLLNLLQLIEQSIICRRILMLVLKSEEKVGYGKNQNLSSLYFV